MKYPDDAKSTLEKKWECRGIVNPSDLYQLVRVLINERDSHYSNWRDAEMAYQTADRERNSLRNRLIAAGAMIPKEIV